MIRAVLIDLSGTLHIGNKAIPGAVDALNRLSNTDLTIKFVTNTTKESQRIIYERLINLGFNVNKNDIHSSLSAAKSLIIRENLKPYFLLSPDAFEDFQEFELKENEQPNAVVVGLAPSEFHYEKLNQAFKYLLNGAQLIAIHAGKYYKREDGLALGPGCFVKGLEYSAQCKSRIVGKPNPDFFLSATPQFKPDEMVMIGDDVNDDVEGAMNVGIQGFLVQTGKYQAGDEKKIATPPSAVVASFVEAVDEIFRRINK